MSKGQVLIGIGIFIIIAGIILVFSPQSELASIISRQSDQNPSGLDTLATSVLYGTTPGITEVYRFPMVIASEEVYFHNDGKYFFIMENHPIFADISDTNILFGLYSKEYIKNHNDLDRFISQKYNLMNSDRPVDAEALKKKTALHLMLLEKGEGTVTGTMEHFPLLDGEISGVIFIPNGEEVKHIYIDDTIFTMTTAYDQLQIKKQNENNTIMQGFSLILVGIVPLEIGSRLIKK